MTSAIHNINIDCADPYRLALFWGEVTGWTEDPDNGNAPDDPEALLVSPDRQLHLLFIAGPDVKAGKNRLHLDLRPTDRTRDDEVTRLLALGASLVDDRRRTRHQLIIGKRAIFGQTIPPLPMINSHGRA